ncbi:DEAD/DEAH box helicase domain-containing protein [Ditylenchus destructor]|uniref:RNA helicase n=1 Tax=Ditylenchus destructor TaxID=166010 RepID=A0AAD4NGG0_9BILA|nr:DEAD/DEAH box helicase domain-containing protein [Ditylenchus destructor]
MVDVTNGFDAIPQPNEPLLNAPFEDVYRKNIHKRFGQRLQKFAKTDRDDSELFEGDILAGPAFDRLNNDESLITVSGGDNTQTPFLMNFHNAEFLPALCKNMMDKGIQKPTLIQKCTIPIILDKPDYDLMARAETGSGKTAAFLLPIIDLLVRGKMDKSITELGPFVIIVSPTRELAQQLGDNTKAFIRGLPLKVTTTYGETCINDARDDIRAGADIVVASPGRLKQFVNEDIIKVEKLRYIVLDEADKLLQDQFKPEMELVRDRVVEANPKCRTFMFSATLGHKMQCLASRLLRPNYFCASVDNNDNDLAISETIFEEFVEAGEYDKVDKLEKILQQLYTDVFTDENGLDWHRLPKTLIFCNNRRRTNWLALQLSLRAFKALSTNGDRMQHQRQQAMDMFVRGDCDILVATNIVARGLNIPGVEHVINYELPKDLEDYIHRIGRTGRAGNSGNATALIDRNKVVDRQLCRFLIPRLESKQHIAQTIPEFMYDIAGLAFDN